MGQSERTGVAWEVRFPFVGKGILVGMGKCAQVRGVTTTIEAIYEDGMLRLPEESPIRTWDKTKSER